MSTLTRASKKRRLLEEEEENRLRSSSSSSSNGQEEASPPPIAAATTAVPPTTQKLVDHVPRMTKFDLMYMIRLHTGTRAPDADDFDSEMSDDEERSILNTIGQGILKSGRVAEEVWGIVQDSYDNSIPEEQRPIWPPHNWRPPEPTLASYIPRAPLQLVQEVVKIHLGFQNNDDFPLSGMNRGSLDYMAKDIIVSGKAAPDILAILQDSWIKVQSATKNLLEKEEICFNHILPYVGYGHYFFVAGVCRQWRRLYQEYFDSLLPQEKDSKDDKTKKLAKLPKVSYITEARSYANVYFIQSFSYWDPWGNDRWNGGWAHLGEKKVVHEKSTFYRFAFSNQQCAEYWLDDQSDEYYNPELPWDYVCHSIAMWGDLAALKWAHEEKNFPITKEKRFMRNLSSSRPISNICSVAVRNKGDVVDMLQYLHEEKDCPFNADTAAWAARYGNFGALKYVHEATIEEDRNSELGSNVCHAAAKGGHLKCLKYAHQNGYPWPTLSNVPYASPQYGGWRWNVCCVAATEGHKDCLKYAYENGCPWPTMDADLKSMWKKMKKKDSPRHAECLEYAQQNGFPSDEYFARQQQDDD